MSDSGRGRRWLAAVAALALSNVVFAGEIFEHTVPGANYGGPLATHGTELDGEPISEQTSRPGMADPELEWRETIAPATMPDEAPTGSGRYQGPHEGAYG